MTGMTPHFSPRISQAKTMEIYSHSVNTDKIIADKHNLYILHPTKIGELKAMIVELAMDMYPMA